jgi:hypothetical protein
MSGKTNEKTSPEKRTEKQMKKGPRKNAWKNLRKNSLRKQFFLAMKNHGSRPRKNYEKNDFVIHCTLLEPPFGAATFFHQLSAALLESRMKSQLDKAFFHGRFFTDVFSPTLSAYIC